MPSLRKHCATSRQRTGKSYEDLHEWMDEGQIALGKDHRRERHDLAYLSFVGKKWGKEGQIEFIQHIIEDYQDTLSKIKEDREAMP